MTAISAVEQGAAKVHSQLKLRHDGHAWADIADESRLLETTILESLTERPCFIGDLLDGTIPRLVTAWQRLRNLGLIVMCSEGWKAKEEAA